MVTNNPERNDQPSTGIGPVFVGVDFGVIGVATSRTRPFAEGSERSSWLAMEDYAALVGDRIPVRTLCLPLSRRDAGGVAARITELPSRVAAVLVIGLDPTNSAIVKRAVADRGGPVVICESDLVTVAMVAATVNTVRWCQVPRKRARVVVTGAGALPLFGAVLMASGGGRITCWNERDAQAVPLRRLMEHHDVLLDLAAIAPHNAAPGRTLTLPDEPFDYGSLVLPGLLSAVCGHAATTVTIDMLAASAKALALVTPPGRVLPHLNDRLLILAVARHVSKTLDELPSTYPHS